MRYPPVGQSKNRWGGITSENIHALPILSPQKVINSEMVTGTARLIGSANPIPCFVENNKITLRCFSSLMKARFSVGQLQWLEENNTWLYPVDSSVGRAVDCRMENQCEIKTGTWDIHRSLVQLRLDGSNLLDWLKPSAFVGHDSVPRYLSFPVVKIWKMFQLNSNIYCELKMLIVCIRFVREKVNGEKENNEAKKFTQPGCTVV